ncbi:uncharacterized protein J8A68_002796 [[Candida] subhashii]|uniref:Helicase C-terminal domain-containing protein n=1 Tax=[Candida] subhashii TaxID=561895 RepID=A0A8J5UXK0_9ASCO|nr:uncharacterized protein J8A68_002796 [[Candida] subhashii]KAG7663680.1 hypothetical protein J8A68_002796 [[Candida] subhashii]
MPFSLSNYQKAIEISNDLRRLIPVGCLNFYDLPLSMTDLYGIHSPDGWKWFDIDFFVHICQGKVNKIILYLQFLIDFQFFKATFKIFSLKEDREIKICKVRLYAIPKDIDGARYINDWRSERPKKFNIDKNYRTFFEIILRYIDFSKSGWNMDTIVPIDEFLSNPIVLFHHTKESAMMKPNIDEFNYIVNRWKNNSYVTFCESKSNETSFGKTIRNIYNSIPSPHLSGHKISERGNINSLNPEVQLSALSQSLKAGTLVTITGVKSTLYPFQIRSVASMLERETKPEMSLIPNLIKLKSPLGNSDYYFDLTNKLICSKPEMLSLPRGGILAENMGSGKTLICLALVCLSKYEFSKITDELLLEGGSVPTNIEGMKIEEEATMHCSYVKPLRTICQQTVVQNSLPWKHFASDLPESVSDSLTSQPGYFRVTTEKFTGGLSKRRGRSSRTNQIPQTRKLYLCNTTIIIIPDNLFAQWNTEIKKHIGQEYLQILFISNYFKTPIEASTKTYTKSLPQDPTELVKYDLVVLSSSCLTKEDMEDNPVMQLYWKRVIIDEGHSVNSKTSRMSSLSKYLFAERKWVVSGTPTSGLTHLYMDEEEKAHQNRYVIKSKFDEKEDLIKLGTIIGNFLKIEPFATFPRKWSSMIIKPLLQNVYGSELTLSNLLNEIMIRHNPRDIERDLKLPQLHHSAVFLKPSYHNIISVNLFTAVLAVNAVTSERTDIDYMFHPANRQQLRKLITNLQRATFHWTGFKQEDVETLIHICLTSLKRQEEKGSYSDVDVQLLNRAMKAANMALKNRQWRTSSLLHEMNYYVSGLPESIARVLVTGKIENQEISVFGAPHLLSLQEFWYKNRYDNETRLSEKLESVAKTFWDNYWKQTVKRNSERFKKQDQTQDFETKINSTASSIQGENTQHVKSEDIKETFSVSRRHKLQDEHSLKKDVALEVSKLDRFDHSTATDISSFEKIRQARILGTASSKLSYLASRLLEHQRMSVKSLVFFEFEDTAYYLTELLDILGINYILYATFISPTIRAKNLVEFSNHDNESLGGITLIMDIRLAAHGLTIISATHVYFISPIWHQSIEAQAIKRAHRIGQTREVYVETLILEGTLEEEIYKKRGLDQEDDNKERFAIDNTGIQEYVMRHEFLDMDDNMAQYSSFKAPSLVKESIIKDSVDEYSLLRHSSHVDDHGNRSWDVFLFSEESLKKLNQIQGIRVRDAATSQEFIQQIVNTEERPRKRLIVPDSRVQSNKRVRF